MIVSIGLALFLRYLFLFLFGGSTRPYPEYQAQKGIEPRPDRPRAPSDYVVDGASRSSSSSPSILALLRTRIGKATRAVADNPALAASSGIDVDRVIRIVWVAGGALAGLGGILLGLAAEVNFEMGFQILLLMFAGVTLGGLGTAFGALVGSLVVGLFIELSTLWLPPELKNVGALAILISSSSSGRRASSAARSGSAEGRRPWTGHDLLQRRSRPPSASQTVVLRARRHRPQRPLRLHRPAQLRPGRLPRRRRLRPGHHRRRPSACRSGSASSIGLVAAVLLALLLGIPTLRLRADYLAIVTIAAAEIIRLIVRSVHASRRPSAARTACQAFADDFYALNPLPGGHVRHRQVRLQRAAACGC